MTARKRKLSALTTLLGQRLAAHAFCETHPSSAAEEDCPFCADRMAYAEYLAAGGEDFRLS